MILFRFVGLLLDLLLLPLRLVRRARAVAEGAFVALEIDGHVADVVAKPRFWEVRAQRATSLYQVSRIVDQIVSDGRVRGLLVVLRDLGGGLATASSLRAVLARARAAGKDVVVHLPLGGGTKEVVVATAATKLVLAPATQLSPLGFLSSSRYMKRALDRAGIAPEIIAAGKYKSAGENLTRDSMSEPQREQLGKLLDGFEDALISAIADGRSVDAERARAIVDGAPYFGDAAVRAGLADAIAYEDEVAALVGLDEPTPTSTPTSRAKPKPKPKPKSKSKSNAARGALVSSSRRLVDGDAYVALRTRPLLRPVLGRPVVAVVPVHGAIAHATGLFGDLATDERVGRMLRLARLDPRVQGVIVHVDSPGGSALASDRMHHEIVQLAREKPVVACMANVAASGGYYVAAPAHRIVCEATTITGSIGVVAARFSLEPLFARIGIATETVRRGGRAGLLSPSLPLTDDEHAALVREIEAIYGAFVSVVARGRKMSEDEVESLARGRVYTGKDALAVGLVDALGGFEAAMQEIRALLPAAVRDRAEPVMMQRPRRPVPAPDPPSEGEAGRRAASALLAAVLPERERALVALAASGERVLALFTGSVDAP